MPVKRFASHIASYTRPYVRQAARSLRPLADLTASGLRIALQPFMPLRRHLERQLAPLIIRIHRSRLGKHWRELRKARLAVSSLLIMGLIAGFILPALNAHATSITWTNNSDFSNNKIGRCQITTMNGVVVSGTNYSDPTCASAGADASLTLDSAPNYLSDITNVVTGGAGSTLALKADGTVWAWGSNSLGQLGDGTTVLQPLPVQVKDAAGTGYLTGVKSIVSDASSMSLAVKTDGTVWAWGNNNLGQIGDGTTTTRLLPVQVKDTPGTGFLTNVATATTSGNGTTFAIKTDGTAWAWGLNGNGQIGDNSITNRSLPVQVKDTAGTGFFSNASKITSVSGTTVALKTDGTAWAWGLNANGQLGNNTTTQSRLPIQVKDTPGTGFLTGVSSIMTSGPTSIALKSDGTVWAWGLNSSGQLGDNTTTTRLLPVQVKDTPGTGFLTGASSVTTSSNGSTVALKSDGTVWAWGFNNNGQLGDGTTLNHWTPYQVKDTPGTGFLTGASSVTTSSNGSSIALKSDGTVWAWGFNNSGQLGDGTTTTRTLPVQAKNTDGTGFVMGISSIATSTNGTTLAVASDGKAWGWGNSSSGQSGYHVGTQNATQLLPAATVAAYSTNGITGVSDIVTSGGTTIALKTDGTVWGWGSNSNGQLGDGTNITRSTPVQVKDSLGVGYLTGITSVTTTGNGTTTALKSDGTLWSWGFNLTGQVGRGWGPDTWLPGQVMDSTGTGYLTDVVSFTSGQQGGGGNTYALKSDGTVWAWGYNSSVGQLGNGTLNASSPFPVQVKDSTGNGYLTGVKRIIQDNGNSYHGTMFALKTDNTLWGWGNNGWGQLGDGTTTNRSLPVQVKDAAGTGYLTDVADISVGSGQSSCGPPSTLVRLTNGTLWSIGNNANGQLGDGTTTNRSLPVQVKDATGTAFFANAQSIVKAGCTSMVLKTDGTLWAWGINASGQLGDGTTTQRTLPIQVKDAAGTGFITGISKISVTPLGSVLAVMSSGTVFAWGNNVSGQLGDNSVTNRTLPVQVKDPSGVGFLGGAATVVTNPNSASVGNSSVQSTFVTKSDGSIWAWGNNISGQLGENTVQNRLLPTAPYMTIAFNSGSGYATTGTATGYLVDAGVNRLSSWTNLTWETAALPAGTSVVLDARTSVSGGTWSSWTSAPAQSTAGSTSGSVDLSGLPYARYLEIRITLTSNGTSTPTLNDFTLGMNIDTTPPSANAGELALQQSSTGAPITDGTWTNAATPYASWTPGEDNASGSGIAGYCLYLGQNASADVGADKGLLGTSPMDSGGLCPFATSATNLDLATAGLLATPLTASNTPYYLLVKAFDNAHNLYANPATSVSFRYDDVAPNNVSYISLPSQFVATKDVTITWPTTGAQSASDGTSGIAGLQYRIGNTGTWYGAAHNGNQDASDVLPLNDGSYRTHSTYDYPLLEEGNNMIYFRAIDNAGNASSSYTSAVIKINSSAPSTPQSLTATPTTNTNNSFAFSWQPPATFVGEANTLTYCYTVNTLPTVNTCSDTTAGQTSLSAGAYATQPGDNTFYVVARDQAGNINYATAASVTFTANTPAPGLPLNVEIADVSVKTTSNWKLALSWEAPTSTGVGVANYRILRSTSPTTGFAQIATTAGLSHVDTGLAATSYYYQVRACDSANNCGAPSSAVTMLPSGRYTTPAELIGSPSVVSSTRQATIDWTTARHSNSSIQFGTKSGVYQPTEATISGQTKTHEVSLTGLEADTTYFYRAKWTDEDGNIGTSSELSFTTLPAPKIKNLQVTKTSLNGATIQFTSTDATKVKLHYGKTDSFGGVKSINTSRAESTYAVQLDGLDDGASYSFRVDTTDADGYTYPGEVHTFTTPPRPRISNLRFQPIADQPTSTQIISWTTNVPSNSTITYGKVGTNGTDITSGKLVTNHELRVNDLEDNSTYFLLAQSRDADGNLATSERQTFKTALDTRPPKISDISVETAVKGNGSAARGQVIVSWKTDEPATSQVAYGQGSGKLTAKTAEDGRLTYDHIVIVSDLAVSKIYSIQPISSDKTENQATGKPQSAIIGRGSDSVLNIVLNSLNKVFGW